MELKLESSWKIALKEELEKSYFLELMRFIQEEYVRFPKGVFPPNDQVFRAFNACPLSNVKVVILGQDPYPTAGHANGLCFSCEADVKPLPKSLKNIFKELGTDIGGVPSTGDLSFWADQGVLMLNATLTVREGQPESHANKGWEIFTDAVISALNTQTEGVVYLLWGSKAQEKAKNVDSVKNLVLKAPHPSPLSAYRGFFGSNHFSTCNTYLESRNMDAIRWV